MGLEYEKYLHEAIKAAVEAGKQTLYYYQQPMKIRYKTDNTPVTQADMDAHDLISTRLLALDNTIPILSEESAEVPWEIRQSWPLYWLCDPIDGTREFMRGRPEFTVNIALIHHDQPVLGVVYAPALKRLYYARKDHGAYRQIENATPELLPLSYEKKSDHWRILSGHKHIAADTDFFRQFTPYSLQVMRSSLKFCALAEGEYDIYPRFDGLMEWDTAAGQCILEAAGGCVVTSTGEPLEYNQKASLKNSAFIAYARSSNS